MILGNEAREMNELRDSMKRTLEFERSVQCSSVRISLVSQPRKSFEHMNILCARISITSLS